MQRLPDFQKQTLPVLVPLMIPEPQLLDAFRCEKLRPLLVTLELFGQAVLKTVQFHRKPRHGTIEVQKVYSFGMLASEFETRESSRLQRTPQCFFLVRLFATETAGNRS